MTAQASILIVDDEPSLVDSLKLVLSSFGYRVASAMSASAALKQFDVTEYDLAIVDVQLPDGSGIDLLGKIHHRSPLTEVIVITAYGTIQLAVDAMRAGAFYFITKPFEPDEIHLLVQKALEHQRLRTRYERLRHVLSERHEYANIIGRSKAMQDVFDTIESVARTEVNVMIAGESGTGKELVAQALHLKSLRAEGPFIAINCAAVPKDLMESELFGHTKGAFTGAAVERRGLIAAAHGGTLLLDEVTEMPVELQAKLLRVIEERHYRPVGSDTLREADFRLISTTNRNPQKAMEERLLRQDLFYRLSTVIIELPPLRRRAEDLPYLCEHFFKEYVAKYNRPLRGFSDEAYDLILNYSWPGNVRELQHVIERAVLCARGNRIQARDLGLRPTSKAETGEGWDSESLTDMSLENMEKLMIRRALARTGGNKQAAAALLGISRTAFYNKLKKYGLASEVHR